MRFEWLERALRWVRKWQCLCPYGPYLLVPLFFTAAALMCTFYAAFECTFFYVTGFSERRVTVSLGIWTVERYRALDPPPVAEPLDNVYIYRTPDHCTAWSKHEEIGKDDIDAPIRAARAVVLLAVLASPVILYYLFRGRHELFTRAAVRALSCGMLGAALLTGLALLALQSSLCQDDRESCRTGFAGYVCMGAVALWILACFTTCTLHGTRGIRRRRRPGESRRERREREREERRRAAERRAMEADVYSEEYGMDGAAGHEGAPLADPDADYSSEYDEPGEGTFRDGAPNYYDDADSTYSDGEPYRDNVMDHDDGASYGSDAPSTSDDSACNSNLRPID